MNTVQTRSFMQSEHILNCCSDTAYGAVKFAVSISYSSVTKHKSDISFSNNTDIVHKYLNQPGF